MMTLLGFQNDASSQSVVQAPRKPHRHITMGKLTPADVAPEFSMAETSPVAGMKKEDPIPNPGKTYDAFIVAGTRLFVQERKTAKIFEIRGLPLGWRPFSDLIWKSNQTLAFDRWSQPHYGVHYAVNVKSRKLVVAAPFPDKFYIEQQRPKQ